MDITKFIKIFILFLVVSTLGWLAGYFVHIIDWRWFSFSFGLFQGIIMGIFTIYILSRMESK